VSRAPRVVAVVVVAVLLAVFAGAGAGFAQGGPAPITVTILFTPGSLPPNFAGAFGPGQPIPITIQVENPGNTDVDTTDGFSASEFFRRLYFTSPSGDLVTNKIEEQSHGDSRFSHCFSRQRVLLPTALPIVPVEVLRGAANPPHFFREYQIPDARAFYDLSRPGAYTVNAQISLLVFELSDPAALVADCDQVPGTNANVAAVTGRTGFTLVSNTLAFEVLGNPPLPPATTAILSPTPGASGWLTKSATVDFVAVSPPPGSPPDTPSVPIQRIVVQTSGAQPGTLTIAGAQGSISITSDGQTNVAYHAEDSGGRSEAPQVLGVKIDTTTPTYSCPGADGLWHAEDLTCSASDATSGLKNAADASFTLTHVPAGTETDSPAIDSRQICDVAGNCTTVAVGTVKIDKKPPTITVTTPAANASYAQNQSVLAAYSCQDGGSGVATCAGSVANDSPIDTSTPGPKSFVVNASDKVGNTAPTTVPYTVLGSGDSIPPTTTASPALPAWSNQPVTITLNATDNVGGSGVKRITYSATGAQSIPSTIVAGSTAPVNVSADGTTTLSFFAEDNAGNVESPAKTLTIKIDKTKPTIAGLPVAGCSIFPPNGQMVQIAAVTASDALSGLAPGSPTVTVTSNEVTKPGDIVVTGGVVRVAATRAPAGSGRIYTVTATATDNAGNTQTTSGTCTVPRDVRR
jgi:hypothetical protein